MPLAILAPVAWRLLLLRHLARAGERAPASNALTCKQLEVATLAGHIKSNGDPGWLVLGRGMHDLLLLEIGWRAREVAEK